MPDIGNGWRSWRNTFRARLGAAACRLRQRHGRAVDGLYKGPHRPDLEGRCRISGMAGVHGEILSELGSVLQPAGFDNAMGVLSTAYIKDPTDPTWKADAGYREWLAFMEKYFPSSARCCSLPASTTPWACCRRPI